MTKIEFLRVHPKIINNTDASLIDYNILHKKIQDTPFLQSRVSLNWLTKNAEAIEKGMFDAFEFFVKTKRYDANAEINPHSILENPMHIISQEEFNKMDDNFLLR